MDFGDRADGASWVGRAGVLVDGDGGWQPFDRIDVGALELFEEEPSIGGKPFEVAPAPLGVQGVEGERAFSRSRDAGQDDKPIARQVNVEIPKVVDSRLGRE